ncbi:PLC-like phosphodiesterase [Amanita rubescens]|nr:PLC-like phosphodiesterase [Amanita rubescens]
MSQQVTVANLTQDTLSCYLQHKKVRIDEAASLTSLSPFVSKTIPLPSPAARRFRLFLSRKDESQVYFDVRMRSKAWKAIRTSYSVPWRIYVVRKPSDGLKILIIPKRDTSTFLSAIPDDTPLSSVLLPGTHDSMAFYGWPISQCQSLSTPLAVQLVSGIRFLDVRLSVVQGRLISYHGIYPERTPFQVILSTMSVFLSRFPTSCETIVVSIKQEDFEDTPPDKFSLLVRDEIINSPGGIGMWFLEDRIPRLGEVRGKAVMFSRFGGDGFGWKEGLGIHPRRWPDSEKCGFTWRCNDTQVRTHDWYNISSFLSIPEKVELAAENLILDSPNPPFPILPITYFSAASFPLAFPTVVAQGFGWPQLGLGVEGVNSRFGRWLLERLLNKAKDVAQTDDKQSPDESVIRGWTFLDFYAEPAGRAVVPLLIEYNFLDN